MNKKICSVCHTEKYETDFHPRYDREKLSNYCKSCLYSSQKLRWQKRKAEAVQLFGGKCIKCGYNKNYSALHFHHRNPKEKEFVWNKLVLKNWNSVIEELMKCDLLCSICHAETHYPQLDVKYFNNHISDLEEKISLEKSNTLKNKLTKKRSSSKTVKTVKIANKCQVCDQSTNNKKYCSDKCSRLSSRKIKERPSKEELEILIQNKSYCQIGRDFGVSDTAVRKWARSYGLIL